MSNNKYYSIIKFQRTPRSAMSSIRTQRIWLSALSLINQTEDLNGPDLVLLYPVSSFQLDQKSSTPLSIVIVHAH